MNENSNIKLYHYCDKEFILNKKENYNLDKYRFCLVDTRWKPTGLWVSVEDDWEKWCIDNNFKLEYIKCKYLIELKEDANVLYIKSKNELSEFTDIYKSNDQILNKYIYNIDWGFLKKKYQGIIISPYMYDMYDFSLNFIWYYGWDCSSGCIWDINCIKDFVLVK